MLYDRDLSWLIFNFRILQEAADKTVPLYERLKFLSIFSSNLDEFFRVRYPSVVAVSRLGKKTRMEINPSDIDNDLPEKVQNEISRQLNIFGNVLNNEIIPELKNNGTVFYYNSKIRAEHIPEVREIFLSQVLSFIQPIFLEGNHHGFMPENSLLYLVVTLKEKDHGNLKQAIINIPSLKLKRFFVLTPIEEFEYVIFIDDIIRENLVYLFPGLTIVGVYSIKFNRDAELHLIEDYDTNLSARIEKQLKKRNFGTPSRFLYESGMPRNLQLFLASAFGVVYEDMFAGGRYHQLSDLVSFPSFNKNLYYKKWKPIPSANIINSGDIFNVLESQDILLHIPYQSYNPVLSFFNQSAVDAEVTDIFITLYRVATESHIVNALISAARNGKNVIAFIELKARFDEANNIRWSKVMKEVGVKIIYSIPNIKVHSKIALVKKQKEHEVLSYGILSTGNFNETTAQFYTDHVLMTTDPFILDEMFKLFRFLQKEKILKHDAIKFDKLLVAQFNLNERLESYIDHEIKKANRGEEALIRIKVNNLEEPYFINLLCKAGMAGVKVNLIIRSICCLRPGVPGKSENITIKRVIGRYLEHTRLLIFGTDNDAVVIMGSADLMNRNLHERIEVCVALKNSAIKKELMDYFEIQWKETKQVESISGTSEMNVEKSEVVNDVQHSIYTYLQNKT